MIDHSRKNYLKIGIVCYPTYGGSGVIATELGKSLANKGHSVHFITYAMPMRLDKFHENIYYHEVELPNYPLFEFQLYSLALASKIIDVVRYEKLEVLHVHYAIPHAVSGYLAKQVLNDDTMKLVTTLHGTDITLVGLEPSFHPLVKFSLEQSDAVTAVSEYLLDKTKQYFKTEKQISCIPNFVDTKVYVPGDKCSQFRSQIAPNEEFVLIHTSNFRQVKRVQDTIRILAELKSHIPVRLVLVGDGPERTDTERLARELDVWESVRFLGKQSAIPDLLRAADLFLLPSQSESFGLSALEAMSCGLPVIGTNIGGIPEVVVHGETGFVAEVGDVQRMARYVLDLYQNKKKYSAFSKRSRELVVEKFDIDLIVPMYEQLYNSLL